jgi:hypothetical protein
MAELAYVMTGTLEGREKPILTVLTNCGKRGSSFCIKQEQSPLRIKIYKL